GAVSAAGVRVLGDRRPVPPLAAPQPIRPLQAAAITAPNGLHVRCARRSGVPLIELRLWVPVGTDQAATAELLAAALPGAAAQRDRAEFDAALAAGGGSVRITVDPQRLLVSATAPAAP